MSEHRGTYRDRCEGMGRERASHCMVLSVGERRSGGAVAARERQVPPWAKCVLDVEPHGGGLTGHEAVGQAQAKKRKVRERGQQRVPVAACRCCPLLAGRR